jgi:hypothetical protein
MGDEFSWGAWTPIGFPVVGVAPAAKLAAASNHDGHLEVFAVGADGAVWHTWQTALNGPWFPGWASLGQPAGVSFASPPPQGVIHVERNQDGRLEVFVTGDDGNMWHIWQAVRDANWIDGWESLGRPDGLAAPGFNQALVRNEHDELEVFVSNPDTGEIWSIRQQVPNGGWVANWQSLGAPAPGLSSYDVVRGGAATNLRWTEVVAVGGDGAIWHNVRWFGLVGVWAGWSVIASPPPGASLGIVEALRKNQDSRLELTCSGANGDYWHTWQNAPPDPDNWNGSWDNLGQPPGGTGGGFDMQLDAQGQLEGVNWGSADGGGQTKAFFLYRIRQAAPNNGWVTWAAINRDINVYGDSRLVAEQNENGTLDVFTHGDSGSIYHIAQLHDR